MHYTKLRFMKNIFIMTSQNRSMISSEHKTRTCLLGTVNTTSVRSSHQSYSVKIGVLKNATNFTWKHLCWSLFSTKLPAFEPATLLKRDSNTGVFLWVLRNVKSSFFYRKPPVAASEFVTCACYVKEVISLFMKLRSRLSSVMIAAF